MADAGPEVLMVAGEASADAHGAAVLHALKNKSAEIRVFGVGGAALRQAGLEPIAPAEAISVAGLTEVVGAIPRIWRIMRQLEAEVRRRKPRVAVLIDLPDFNLRLAERLKRHGVFVIYYISPQVWAWRPKRVERIRQVVDRMLVVLPFEETFYRKHNINAEFVGHPLIEAQKLSPTVQSPNEARACLGIADDAYPVIALLPGSRRLEVMRHLGPMIQSLNVLRRLYPKIHAVLPLASTVPEAWVLPLAHKAHAPIAIVPQQAREALVACDVAVVCSGTATLETALLQRPMVVVYRVSEASYVLLKRLIKVPYIALVNLIAQDRWVPELVQEKLTPAAIASEVITFLEDDEVRTKLVARLGRLKDELGHIEPAPRVAEAVTRALEATQGFS